MSEVHEIAFQATVNKVQTLADGGIRVTFDLPETAIAEAALLMECKRQGINVAVDCKAKENNDAIPKRQIRQSQWQAAQESDMDQDTGDGRQQD